MNILEFMRVGGWILIGVPILVAVTMSALFIINVAREEEVIMSFVMLGLAMFLVGCVLLFVSYFPDIF